MFSNGIHKGILSYCPLRPGYKLKNAAIGNRGGCCIICIAEKEPDIC